VLDEVRGGRSVPPLRDRVAGEWPIPPARGDDVPEVPPGNPGSRP
jgi:hypothetical protein